MRYFKPTDTTNIYFNQSLFIGDFSLPPFCLVSPARGDCVRATVRELNRQDVYGGTMFCDVCDVM